MKRLFNHSALSRRSDRREAIRKADEARDAGNPASAATLYGFVLDRFGRHFGVLVQMGNALKDSGAYDRAEETYVKALEIQPLDADCHLQLGHLMKLAGKPDRAAEYYQEAYRLNPTLPGAILELRSITSRQEISNGNPEMTAVDGEPQMQAQAIDRGRRSVVIRERLASGYTWRRS